MSTVFHDGSAPRQPMPKIHQTVAMIVIQPKKPVSASNVPTRTPMLVDEQQPDRTHEDRDGDRDDEDAADGHREVDAGEDGGVERGHHQRLLS